jgi:hypothetical protein
MLSRSTCILWVVGGGKLPAALATLAYVLGRVRGVKDALFTAVRLSTAFLIASFLSSSVCGNITLETLFVCRLDCIMDCILDEGDVFQQWMSS